MRRRWWYHDAAWDPVTLFGGAPVDHTLTGIGGRDGRGRTSVSAVRSAGAGARRPSSAATRLYAHGQVADVEVDPPSQSSGTDANVVAGLRRLPEVRHATTAEFFPGARVRGNRPPAGLDVFFA